MEDLSAMDLDDETYQDIIDKVGDEINDILASMKQDREMKKKFISEMYKDGSSQKGKDPDDELRHHKLGPDSPVNEYYIQDGSERSRRLPSSSDNSNIFKKSQSKDENTEDSEKQAHQHFSLGNIEEDMKSNSNSKETIGAHSFTAHELLGTGSFGEVYLVEKISDHTLHAMKVL